ncbi:MAG: hypothetical protein ACXVJW_16560 [Acidimicrobiia bacterium]
MAVTVVRYKTKPDRAEENQAFVEQVFAELDAKRPDGLRYMTFRLADGVTFVHVASVETEDGTNPLTGVNAFGLFQQEIADRCEEGPLPMAATVVGSYGFPTGADHPEA